MESLLWLFTGILIVIGAMIIFSSRGADRNFAIFIYVMSCIPFGGAIYFMLVALKIIKVFIFLPLK